MKKLLFGLIATVMFGFAGNAQESSKNPYDYAGKIHNDVLDVFFKKYYKPKMSFDEISQITKKLFLNNDDFIKYFGENDYSKINFTKDYMNETIKDLPNQFKNIISKYSQDENLNLYLNEYIRGVLKFMNDDYPEKMVYNYVIEFEDIILKSSLNEEQKKQILISTSITRFSNYYWNNSGVTSFKRGWLADAIGGIIGGVVGSIIEPGYGTYAGAVIGAGAASGGVEAIKESK
jgi:hypothetical protein